MKKWALAAFVFVGCGVDTESALTARLRRVTKETPEFGGVRRTDAQAPLSGGTLSVFVRSPAAVPSATARVTEIFAPDLAPTIKLRAAKGPAAEASKVAAKDVLSVHDASTLDFDETTGYLRVGVASAESLPSLENKIDALGLDPESIIVQVETPFTF